MVKRLKQSRRLWSATGNSDWSLLFLCHIHDLSIAVKSTVCFFADDCLLYRQIKFREDHISLTQDLQSLGEWPTTWAINLNNKICYIMSINAKSTQLDGHILQQIPENPYLGETIPDDLYQNY